jgi:hypothetical protein
MPVRSWESGMCTGEIEHREQWKEVIYYVVLLLCDSIKFSFEQHKYDL